MYVGYFYAVRGAMKQEERLATITNNLANAATPGFKKDRNEFQSFLINEIKTDMSQGPLRQTERDLDIALEGPGFFKLATPKGLAYSRNGAFHVGADGQVKSGDGYNLMGEGGAINLGTDPGVVMVDSQGNITKNGEVVDSIQIVNLAETTHLKPAGGSTLIWDGPGQPREVAAVETTISQGFLEDSNVSPVNEMVHMIDSHRSFEAFSKAIKSFQDIDQKAATQVGRLRQ